MESVSNTSKNTLRNTGASQTLAYWIVPSWATLIAAKDSLLLAAINLIPLPPFDGFPIVEAFLAKRGLRIDESQWRQLFTIGIGTMVVLTLVL